MTKSISINEMSVSLVLERIQRVLRATMLIGKPDRVDPLRDDTIALIIEAADGSLLTPTNWPTPGFLPEVSTRGTTANATFEFDLPARTALKRAIAVIRGDFGQIDITRESL